MSEQASAVGREGKARFHWETCSACDCSRLYRLHSRQIVNSIAVLLQEEHLLDSRRLIIVTSICMTIDIADIALLSPWGLDICALSGRQASCLARTMRYDLHMFRHTFPIKARVERRQLFVGDRYAFLLDARRYHHDHQREPSRYLQPCTQHNVFYLFSDVTMFL